MTAGCFKSRLPFNRVLVGGPLLDRGSAVVGIVVSKLDALPVAAVTDDIPQNGNLAVKGSLVAAYLKAHNVPYIVAGGSKNATLSTVELARRLFKLTASAEWIRRARRALSSHERAGATPGSLSEICNCEEFTQSPTLRAGSYRSGTYAGAGTYAPTRPRAWLSNKRR